MNTQIEKNEYDNISSDCIYLTDTIDNFQSIIGVH